MRADGPRASRVTAKRVGGGFESPRSQPLSYTPVAGGRGGAEAEEEGVGVGRPG